MPRRRQRRRDGAPPKQVNPLKAQYLKLLEDLPADWLAASFADPSLPFVVDVGCGDGEWVLAAAASRRGRAYNFLGLEVRKECVAAANAKRGLGGPGNALCVAANAAAGDVATLLAACGTVAACAFRCPDPHWKGAHRNRRMITRPLLGQCAAALSESGFLFVSTDVVEVADDVLAQLRRPPVFVEEVYVSLRGESPRTDRRGPAGGAAEAEALFLGPEALPTEREGYVGRLGGTMSRCLLRLRAGARGEALRAGAASVSRRDSAPADVVEESAGLMGLFGEEGDE